MKRLTLVAIASTLALAACGDTTHRMAQSTHNPSANSAPGSAYCQAAAASEQRPDGCPQLVPSTTCKYTHAGIKLCGEDAREYCEQSSEKGGCDSILEAVARSAGKPQRARRLEELDSYAACAQYEGGEQCRREGAERPEEHAPEPTGPLPPVALSLRTSAPVYVCLIGDNGRKLIPGVELQPGEKRTYRGGHFLLALGNSSVTMIVDGKAMSVPSSSQAIGYSITKAGGRTPLALGQLPTCAP